MALCGIWRERIRIVFVLINTPAPAPHAATHEVSERSERGAACGRGRRRGTRTAMLRSLCYVPQAATHEVSERSERGTRTGLRLAQSQDTIS